MPRHEILLNISDKIDVIKIAYNGDIFSISNTRTPVKDENNNWHIFAECEDIKLLIELVFYPDSFLWEITDFKNL